MDLLTGKIVCLLGFLIFALLATLLPLLANRRNRSSLHGNKSRLQIVMEYANSIAGGVFLATCFAALLPFVRNSFKKALEAKDFDVHKPYGETVILLGFFLVVFIEQGITNHGAARNKSTTSSDKVGHEEKESLLSENEDNQNHCNHHKKQPDSSASHAGHSHSHQFSSTSLLHSIILVITLGIHTLFEGIAIGLLNDMELLIMLVIAVLIHEVCCAAALGINISQQKISKKSAIAVCVAFSLMMPAGITVGILLGEVRGFSGLLLTAIMQGLATGTFMFVLFLEIVPSIFSQNHAVRHILAMLSGCLLMTALIVFTHDHGDHDGHSMVSNSSVLLIKTNSSSP